MSYFSPRLIRACGDERGVTVLSSRRPGHILLEPLVFRYPQSCAGGSFVTLVIKSLYNEQCRFSTLPLLDAGDCLLALWQGLFGDLRRLAQVGGDRAEASPSYKTEANPRGGRKRAGDSQGRSGHWEDEPG